MTLRFAKRIASQVLDRGQSSIRFKPDALEEISKAITRDDIRRLVKNGSIIALKEKDNLSLRAKELRKKRSEGRGRGRGRRKGTLKARMGTGMWEKKVRSQRLFLRELRNDKKVDSKSFRKFYLLVKGNAFANKSSMLLHMKEKGVVVSDEEVARINQRIKDSYK
ncbi:MAG: 50S ribosomal protein L19e [Candidatus Micrarchaeota archaeon]|nr:50S ribosomal protein L19e [Candidatus Micrarchaeota archaeon]MDE1864561.1 50S ribosomal protein L19e [Candidatus Micrarchaeota archaeon]